MARKTKTSEAPESNVDGATKAARTPSDAELDALAGRARERLGSPVRWIRTPGGYGILFPTLPEPFCEPTFGRVLKRGELAEGLRMIAAAGDVLCRERANGSSAPRELTPAEIDERISHAEPAAAATRGD